MPLTEVKQFSVSRLSILDASGNLDASLEPDLKEQDLIKIYRSMVLARELDERMLKLQRQGRLGTFPPNTGQEAISRARRPGHAGQRLVRGRLPRAGRPPGARRAADRDPATTTTAGKRATSCPTTNLRILPDQRGHRLPDRARRGPGLRQPLPGRGRGRRVLHRRRRHQRGRLPRGPELRRGLEGARGLHRARTTSGPSPSRARSRPPAETLAQKGIAYGMPGMQVDGNDALAMHVAITEALDRARAGRGAHPHRGGDLPPDDAHHRRRPQEVPHRGGREVRLGEGAPHPLPQVPGGQGLLGRRQGRGPARPR